MTQPREFFMVAQSMSTAPASSWATIIKQKQIHLNSSSQH